MIFKTDAITSAYNKDHDRPWLIVLSGLPSSGKSTIAQELAEQLPASVVSSDNIRQEIFGKKYVRSIKTFETAKTRIYENLKAGRNVIFDATNVNRYKREAVFGWDRDRYTAVSVHMEETQESCLERNHIRNRVQPVPDYEITNAATKLTKPTADEGFDYRFVVKNQKAEADSGDSRAYPQADGYSTDYVSTIFSGKIFSVEARHITDERGKTTYREIVKHSGASCIMPILPDGNLVFVKEYRSAIEKKMISFPAGIIDPGENSVTCAARELEEETGYKANDIEPVFEIHSSAGFTDEKVSVFVARDLEEGVQNFDGDEFLEVVTMPLDEALRMVFDGEITSAPTVAGLFYLQNNRKREKL